MVHKAYSISLYVAVTLTNCSQILMLKWILLLKNKQTLDYSKLYLRNTVAGTGTINHNSDTTNIHRKLVITIYIHSKSSINRSTLNCVSVLSNWSCLWRYIFLKLIIYSYWQHILHIFVVFYCRCNVHDNDDMVCAYYWFDS